MRKLTHVFWLCLFVCLWIGNVARAQISAVSSPGAVCAGSNVSVNLTGAFNPGCQVNFFLVENGTAGPGVQIAGPLPARSSPAYTLTIPASAAAGNYVIYVTSNCGAGNVAPAFPLVYPTLAGPNYTASFPVQPPYVPSMLGWAGENSLLTTPFGALSTTGTIYGCQGSGTISIVGLFAGDAAPGQSYRWLRNGSPIAGSIASGMVGVTGFLDAAATATLIINNPTLAQGGTYSIELNPTGGACPARLGAITLNINTVPVIVGTFSASNNRICAGSTSTINSLSITGGSNSYCYRWGSTSGTDVDAYSAAAPMPFDPQTVANGGDCNELPTASNPTFTVGGSNLAVGTYQYNLVVIDKVYGCRAQQTNDIVVEVTPSPGVLTATIPATSATFLCTGQTVPISLGTNLTVDGGPTSFHPDIKFSWTGPAGFTSASEDPSFNYTNATAQNGVYSVVATVAGSTCSASTSISISGRQTPNPVISGISQICDGGAVTLTVNPGANVPTSPGILSYTFNGTDVNINGALPVVGPQAANSMTTPSLVLTNNAVGSATYNVTVAYTDAPQCSTVSANHIITVTPTPLTDLAGTRGYFTNGPVAVCEGSTIEINVGSTVGLAAFSAGTTFSWAGPAGFASNLKNPTVTTNAALSHAGTYSVTVMRITGTATCSASATMVVSVAPRPTASIAVPGIVCSGAPVTLNAAGGSASTPGATVTYEWELVGDAASLGPFNPILPIGSVPPVQVYAGPGGIAAFNDGNFGGIVGVPNPIYVATGTKTNTLNVTGIPSMNALGLGGVGVTSNNWGFRVRATITTNGLICRSNSNTINLVVAETPAANVTGNNSPICAGNTLNLTVGNGNVLTQAQTAYAWAGSLGFTSTLRTPSIANAPATASGVYTVSVSNTQYASCSATATTLVEVVPQPVAAVSPDPVVVCAGQPITITASGGVAGSVYQWAQVADHSGNQNTWASTNPINTINNGDNWWATGAKVSGTTTTTFGINPALLDVTTRDVEYSVARVRITTKSADGSLTCASNGFVRIAVVNAPVTPIVQGKTIDGNGVDVTGYSTGTQFLCIDGGANGNASELKLRDNAAHPAGAAVKYKWAGPAGFSSTAASPNVVITSTGQAGVYSVTVSTSVAEGLVGQSCETTGTISVVVSVTPTPAISNLTPAICEGSGVGLQVVGGIPAGSTYAWYVIDNGTPFFASPTPVTSGPNYTPSLAIGAYPAVSPGFVPFSITANQDLLVVTNANAGIGSGPNQLQGFGTGNYGFRVVVNNNGCKATAVTNVAVTANPDPRAWAGTGTTGANATADVSATAKSACTVGGVAGNNTFIALQDTHNYSNDIGVANISWLWSGPNGFTSTMRNPTPFAATTTAQDGVYTVSAVNTANNACVGTATVSVKVIQTPQNVSISSNSPVCAGSPFNLTANGGPIDTYNWAPGNANNTVITAAGGVFSATNVISPSISTTGMPTAGGNYTAFVNVSNGGCAATATTALTLNAMPNNLLAIATQGASPVPMDTRTNAATGVTQYYVCTGTTIGLSASTSNQPATTYTWTGSNGYASNIAAPIIGAATLNESATYTVVAAIGSCSRSAAIVVNVIQKPAVAPSSNSPICAGATLNLSANATLKSGTTTYSWNLSTIPTKSSSTSENPAVSTNNAAAVAGATINMTAINTIAVGPTASYSCSTTGSTTVTINSIPVITGAAPHDGTGANLTSLTDASTGVTQYYICEGSTIGLSATATSVVPPGATVVWSGPNGYTSALTNVTIGGATTNMSGVYIVTASNGAGCTSTASFYVNVIPKPVVAPASNSPVCAGSPLNLSSNVTNKFGTTTYAWTLSNIPGKTSSTSENPVVTTSSANIVSGASLSFTATNKVNVGPLASFTCSTTGTTSVTINSNPAITSAVLTDGSSPLTTITNSSTGVSQYFVCEGSTIGLSASVTSASPPGGTPSAAWAGPNSYASSLPVHTIGAATTNMSGQYVVTFTNSTGCVSTASFFLNVIPKPVVASSATTPVCAGTSIAFTAGVTNKFGTTTYAWAYGGTLTGSSTSENPSKSTSNSNAGVGTGTLTATNKVDFGPTSSFTCVTTGSPVNVTINSAPSNLSITVFNNASATGVPVVAQANPNTGSSSYYMCSGTPLSLSVSASNATTPGPASYVWSGGYSSNIQGPVVTTTLSANNSGDFIVTVLNGGTGCTASAKVNIVVVSTPSLTALSNSPVCAGDAINLSAISANVTSYSWSNGAGYASTQQNPVITNATVGMSGNYSVSATNQLLAANGLTLKECYNSSSVEVTVRPIPNVLSAAVQTIAPGAQSSSSPFIRCEGAALNLAIAVDNTQAPFTNYNWAWSGPGLNATGFSQSLTPASLSQTGTYSVLVTNQFGCTNSNTFSIIVKERPVISVSASPSVLCAGGTVQLNVSSSMAGTSFAWEGPNGFNATTASPSIVNAGVAATGTYMVSATNSGCTTSGSVSVSVNSTPSNGSLVVQLGNNSNNTGPVFTRCEGTAMTLNISNPGNGFTYGWSGPGGFTQTGTSLVLTPTMPSQSGQYTVEARNAAGCSRSTTISIVVKPLPVPTYTLVGNTLCLSATGGNGVFNWTGPEEQVTGTAQVNGFGQNGVPATLLPPSGADYILARAAAGVPSSYSVSSSTFYTGPNPGVGVWTANYTWTGSIKTSTATAPCFSPVLPGYTGTWTVTSGGCSAEFNVSAPTPPPTVVASGSPSALLAGGNVALSAAVTNGPATAYAWSGPCGFSSTSSAPSVNSIGASCGGVYSVTVTASGGTASGTVLISVSTPPPPPGVADLMLIKDSKYRTMRSGTKTYITIIVKNNGPNAASGVTVTDVLPAGMTYTTPSNLTDSVIDDGLEHNGGIYGSFSVSAGTVTANYGTIAAGATKEIKFYVTVSGSVGVTLLNTGSITSSANPDPNSGNNSDEVSILIVPGSSSRVAAGESTDGAIVVKSYPNPATDKVTIELTLDEPSKAELRMTDFSGRTVGEWKLNEETTHHTAEISMKEFKAGLYLLNAEAGTKRAVKKIVKAEN